MDKKVLIISSSPRMGGNSETLAAAFAKGAREAGHQVETVYLREKHVFPAVKNAVVSSSRMWFCTKRDWMRRR